MVPPEKYTLPLHVALLSNARVPVEKYGGTERVITWLTRGLTELGHRVTLLAPPGSQETRATVIPINLIPGQERHFDPRPLLPAGVDVVHAHFPLHPVGDLRLCWTLHGNARQGEVLPPRAIALSADHARRHGLNDWVYNGLDPDDFNYQPRKSKRDLFLGRLHSAKGWRWAVAGARATGRPITIAGGWRPSLRPSLRFAGKVGGAEKAHLLAEAACLWVPVQWDEPFGLTTIEAMVSGTPVLATRRGALPEVITPESGLIGDTLDELIALRPALDRFDPEAVRQNVLARFTHRTMAEGYLGCYRKLVVGDW